MGSASSLIKASTYGDLPKLEKTLKRNVNVECVNADGCSPLFLASRGGHVKLVSRLIKANANPNITNKQGLTPLHIACERGHAKVVQLLARHDITDAGIYDLNGCSALIIATVSGHVAAVTELLNAGVDVNTVVRFRKGYTSLMLAAERGMPVMVSALLRGGADDCIKDEHGRTSLHIGMFIHFDGTHVCREEHLVLVG